MAEEYDPELSSVNNFFNKNLMITLDEGTYFSLNSQTITSLDILPKLKADGTPCHTSNLASSRSDTTVFAVLNKCRTISGQRLLATWLKNPLKSKEKIDTRLEIVKYLVDNIELRNNCYDDYLRKIPDLLRIAHKVEKEKCTLSELIKIYNSHATVQSLCHSYVQLKTMTDVIPPQSVEKLFSWAKDTCNGLSDFVKLIEDSIDLDSVDEAGEYMVKPNSDENLAKICLELSHLVSQARKQLSYVGDDIGLEADKGLKLEIDSERGFGLRVTKHNEQSVRGNPNYQQLSMVKKDGYRFTNKALTKLSVKYVDSKQEYNSFAKSVIEDIITKAVMYDNEVLEFSMSITLIDVFTALATSAVQNGYVKPLILESEAERIHLDKMRHPCVENQPDIENYVPNDVSMSKDAKKFYVITGPNMGGKSTFIKSAAVVVIMAQCGSLIPVEDARISVVDGVYTRVGAGDNQLEGVSTFMEEMMDMSNILKVATRYSFVVIDELGRGTSTFDGFGLAWSISKHLATKCMSYTLFATHFHELTELEDEVPSVGNLHVKAICNADKLTMLYSIDKGVCDDSYGIHVAQYTKFPDHVIETAKEKLKQFEDVKGFSSKKEVREFVKECVRDYLAKSLK